MVQALFSQPPCHPALAGREFTSIRYLRGSSDERTKQQYMAQYLKDRLADHRLPALTSTTHIVPVMVGDAMKCSEISWTLLADHGLYIQPINYPTVPRGTERLRITPGPLHSAEMADQLVDSLARVFDAVTRLLTWPEMENQIHWQASQPHPLTYIQ